jgi:predicted dehydrogenase
MQKEPLKVGIVGCGTVTQTSYAQTFPVLSEIKVTHVYDLNPLIAEKAANIFGAEILPLREMLPEVQAVIIATPPQSHYPLITESLCDGKMVICEKPFVGCRKDAEALVSAAQQNGAQLYVAHFRRMFPHAQLVRSMTETGLLGSVKGLRIIEGGRFSWDAQSGYVMKDPLGGVLFDTGSHTIDMALFAAKLDEGEFLVTVNEVKRDKAEPSHEIKAGFTFRTANGEGKGMAQFSRYQVLANLITIEYERGSLEFSPGLSHRIRLVGNGKTTILFPEYASADYMEPFVQQYKNIFSGTGSDIFHARRFVNLTTVLESIANG